MKTIFVVSKYDNSRGRETWVKPIRFFALEADAVAFASSHAAARGDVKSQSGKDDTNLAFHRWRNGEHGPITVAVHENVLN